MKKTISLLLSVIILLSASLINITAYAAGWINYAKSICFDTWYNDAISDNDYYEYNDWSGGYYYKTFKVNVPVSGQVTIKMNSEDRYYFYHPTYGPNIKVYSEKDVSNEEYKLHLYNYYKQNSAYGYYEINITLNLTNGIHYFVYDVSGKAAKNLQSYFNYSFDYSPSILKPSNLKVNSRKTTSLGLSWSKVGDIDGYQLQRNTSNGWKQVANTISNSYTVKGLKAGVKYDFRVRSYVEADGKKYYSGWKTLATPTKPNTPAIKKPSTNKKHQIIAKWKKVSAGTGYQVQYSKKKNFSSVIATKTVSGISKTSYTGKNFTKGRTYYVRVRAYKAVNGKKYYSAWSKVKSIKCK